MIFDQDGLIDPSLLIPTPNSPPNTTQHADIRPRMKLSDTKVSFGGDDKEASNEDRIVQHSDRIHLLCSNDPPILGSIAKWVPEIWKLMKRVQYLLFSYG